MLMSILLSGDMEVEWWLNYFQDVNIEGGCADCHECLERDGIVKTYKQWEKIGMPGSNKLSCDCGCGILPVVYEDEMMSVDDIRV